MSPSDQTSARGVIAPPDACSGAIHCGEPIAWVSPLPAVWVAIPKSRTLAVNGAPGVCGADLVGALVVCKADGGDLASFNELHTRARNRLAESVRNAAANDDRMRRKSQQTACQC